MKNAPICTLGFSKKIVSDVIWDKEKQVAFYIKNSINDDADTIRSFFFKGQKVEINNYREYGLSNYSYVDYMVDIYGFNAKKVLNISRDYWDGDFESRHSEYLKDLFEKHIAKIKKIETDLLKLTYCVDHTIDFRLSEHWLNGNVNGRKISDILNEVGFYMLDVEGYAPNDDRKAHLRSNFNNYIILESESDNDNFMLYALKNYCKKYGYNKYILRMDEKLHRYPEEVGLIFYSKNIQPSDLCEEYKWDKSELYYSGEVESENVFEELWGSLIRECQFDDYSFHSKYLNLTADKMNLLGDYKKLSFKFREYWDDFLILSPYQVIENEIRPLNIDDLSIYVANRKNDLSNVKEYKRLYEKLIIEIDKYKKTPQ